MVQWYATWSFPRCLNMLSCLISRRILFMVYAVVWWRESDKILSHWLSMQLANMTTILECILVYYYWFANILLVRCRISNGTISLPSYSSTETTFEEDLFCGLINYDFKKKLYVLLAVNLSQIYVQDKYNSKQTSINCTCALLKYKMYNL